MRSSARHSTWAALGLQWAAVERPEAHRRLADALHRWRELGPVARAALVELVLEGRQPEPAPLGQLRAGRFVHGDGDGPNAPLYAGAALVGLEGTRQALTTPKARALLEWYRRGDLRVSPTYLQFHRDRPHGQHMVFRALDREGLILRDSGRRLYRSTVLGWAVAWLLDDAAILELAGREAC